MEMRGWGFKDNTMPRNISFDELIVKVDAASVIIDAALQRNWRLILQEHPDICRNC
jgi:hypothetical protein